MPAFAQDPFERGPEILFTDGLEGEKLGEFPSRWRLVSGRAETAAQRGGTVLSFRTTRTGVKPHMEAVAYLPDSFTLEFEYLVNHATQQSYEVQFLDEAGRREASVRLTGRRYVLVSAQGRTISDSPTPDAADQFISDWRRFALSYNKGELRAFCNEERVLNVPDFRAALRSFVILGGRPANAQPNADAFIRNVVLAAGGMPLYRRVMTEGKFVTTGIQFDVGNADLKP